MAAPTRSPATALFWRLLLLNALVLVIAAAVLALSPLTVSAPVLITEVAVLAVGLVLMLVATAVLLRASLRPLDGLAELMERVDLLRPGERLAVRGNGDVAHLVHTFNDMLDRLESERGASTARALAAQEGERQRIAQELHDEIGQSLTAVLLGLKRVLDRAPDELRDEVSTRRRADPRFASTRCARSPAGCAPACWRTSAWSARSARWPPTSPRPARCPVTRTLDQRLPELSRGRRARPLPDRPGGPDQRGPARGRHPRRAGPHPPAEAGCCCGSPTTAAASAARAEGAGIRGMRERAILIGAALQIEGRSGGGTEVRLLVPSDDTTRILLADDHALVRRGLRLILDGEPDLRVVAEAGDGAEAVEKAARGRRRPRHPRHRHAPHDGPAGGPRDVAAGAPTCGS